jgi:hypothetical protein
MDWELVKDIAIPTAAILVPSGIAIWLARSERTAAARERRLLRVGEGIERALDAMNAFVQAAYTDDFRQAAQLRIEAARHLDAIRVYVGLENQAVWDWIAEELSITAGGLEDTDHLGLPVLMEKIVWRGARFANVMADWRLGKISLEWFESATHNTLSETTLPSGSDEDPATLD